MQHPLTALTGLALLALSSLPAQACRVDVTPIAFGIVDLTRINRANGAIRLLCPVSTEVEVAISGEAMGNGRPLRGPFGHVIWYRIAADSAFRRPWGDGGASGDPVRVQVNGGVQTTLVVYGLVPAQPSVPEGEYQDHLTVIVTY